jgi:uncharacterized protein
MKTVTDELLDEIARRLVAIYDPEEIILFGSHAWGSPDEDSDLDLMVIVGGSLDRPRARSLKGRKALSDLRFSCDLLVKTRSEFEYFANVRSSLSFKILQEGKVIYGPRPQEAGRTVAFEGRQ